MRRFIPTFIPNKPKRGLRLRSYQTRSLHRKNIVFLSENSMWVFLIYRKHNVIYCFAAQHWLKALQIRYMDWTEWLHGSETLYWNLPVLVSYGHGRFLFFISAQNSTIRTKTLSCQNCIFQSSLLKNYILVFQNCTWKKKKCIDWRINVL